MEARLFEVLTLVPPPPKFWAHRCVSPCSVYVVLDLEASPVTSGKHSRVHHIPSPQEEFSVLTHTLTLALQLIDVSVMRGKVARSPERREKVDSAENGRGGCGHVPGARGLPGLEHLPTASPDRCSQSLLFT